MSKRDTEIMNILGLAKEVINSEEYDKIRDKYKDPKQILLTPSGHRIITGHALELAKRVIKYGGTDDEVKLSIINLYICMDALKYQLNWGKFKRDNNINVLVRKYAVKAKEEKEKE